MHLKVHSAYSLLEGALPIGKLAKLAEAHGYPGGRADRHQQPVRRARVLRQARRRRHPADRRLHARRSISRDARAGRRPAARRRERAALAAGRRASRCFASNDGRLRQPDEARQPRASSTPPTTSRRTSRSTRLQELGGGLIALTGGPDGPIDKALRDGQTELAASASKTLANDLRRPPLRRDPAPRPASTRSRRRAAAARRSPTSSALPLVATNEVYFATPDDYEAHDALLCIAEGSYVVEDNRRRADARALLQDRRARWRSCSPICPRRSPTRSRSPSAAPSGRTGRKPILPRFVAGDDRRRARRSSSRLETAELRAPGRGGPDERARGARRRRRASRDEDYEKRLAFEIDVISKMKFPGYFLIVADFIKWAKAQRHPRRAGPRLGRRLGRRLGAHHHRPRSAALRAAVRALPQPRARVDAGLRHRLLPGPPRRGDPLRPGEVRRRPRRADHHPRQAAGARRAARRRPRAADALRPGRPAVQARAQQSGQSGDAGRRRSRASRSCRRSATASRWWRACSRSRRSSRASTATPRRTPPAW